MKKNIRIIVDILMYLCLITLTGYHITNNLLHEILGIIVFVLFIIHNTLNIKWYSSIFKGKHSFRRNMHIIINFLLFVSMFLTIVSGIFMSKSVFKFLGFLKFTAISRKIHLISNAWVIVLVSIHIGMHINPIVLKILKSNFEYGAYILFVIMLIIGVYTVVSNGIMNDMFGITSFKYFNYDESPVIFYFKYIDMSFAIALITNIIINIKKKEEV